jgi:hypothetical protein
MVKLIIFTCRTKVVGDVVTTIVDRRSESGIQ